MPFLGRTDYGGLGRGRRRHSARLRKGNLYAGSAGGHTFAAHVCPFAARICQRMLPTRQALRGTRGVRCRPSLTARLGFVRIVALEIEAPNMLVNLV